MQPSTETDCPWWGKIGLIWLMIVPLCAALYTLAQPLAPNDFWYHVRAGAWMVQYFRFPRVALFTPSVPAGTPYFYQSWLAEILMYLTLKWTGLAGSVILRTICITGSMVILIASAQRRAKILLASCGADAFNQAARRVAAAAILALLMSTANMDLRPQTFSLPLFAVFAAIIFAWSHTGKRQLVIRAICLMALMAIWVNTHGAFATGLILLALFCAAETLYFLWGNPLSPWMGKRLDKAQLGLAWIAFTGSIMAACLNPRGLGIFAYVQELTGNTIGEKYIQEWQPPQWSQGFSAIFFCCGIAVALMLLLLLLVARYYPDSKQSEMDDSPSPPIFGIFGLRPGELLIFAAFFVMGLRNVRSILWFALFFIVVGAALFCRVFPSRPQESLPSISRSSQWGNVILAIILCLSVIPLLPRYKPLLPWPKSYFKRFKPTPPGNFPDGFSNDPPLILGRDTPVGAAIFLRQSQPHGLLWNDMVFGSYLVWTLYPGKGPWADPRVELRPDAFWEDYRNTCYAKNHPERLLPARGFSDVLINKNARMQNNLTQALQKSAAWKLVYQDQTSLLFRHR